MLRPKSHIALISTAGLLLAVRYAWPQGFAIESFSHSGEISWTDTYSNGHYCVEWSSSLTSTNWLSEWDGLTAIPATGGVITVAVPMFYRVVHHPTNAVGGFLETFEDAGGWSDHPEGDWTQSADTGTWESQGDLYAASSAIRAHSGTRYIGVGDNTHGYLYLPPVDNPTQLVFWVRGGVAGWNGRVYIDAHDGMNWIQIATHEVQDTSYVKATVPITFGVPNPDQRIRLKLSANSGLAAYLDDVEVRTSP